MYSCIAFLKRCFPFVKIIKGRPRYPKSQGCIEKSNDTFKRALEKWVSDNGGQNNCDWTLGMYSVVRSINIRGHHARNHTVPYETYFGIDTKSNIDLLLDQETLQSISTEHAYYGVQDVLASGLKVSMRQLQVLIKELDELQNEEENRSDSSPDYDGDQLRREIVKKFLQQLMKQNVQGDHVPDPTHTNAHAGIDYSNTQTKDESHTTGKINSTDASNIKYITVNEQQEFNERKRRRETSEHLCNEGQQEQEKRVNKKRKINYVDTLQRGDVVKVTITTEKSTMNIFAMVLRCNTRNEYELATKYGRIDKYFSRHLLELQPTMTPKLLRISEPSRADDEECFTVKQIASIVSKERLKKKTTQRIKVKT